MGWKKFSYTKKGAIIGLIIGFIWAIVVIMGMLECRWNYVEGNIISVCSSGIFRYLLFLYILFIPLQLIFLTLGDIWGMIFGYTGEYMGGICLILLSLILYFLITALLGALIGFIIGKIKKK